MCDDPAASAKAAGLRYVRDDRPGYTRRRTGRGFVYLDQNGERIRDERTLSRIRSLVIPPAWKQVWICPIANGHIQATGIDQKGRKQYKYHPRWTQFRNETKFYRMIEFGQTLPEIRKRVAADLRTHGLNRRKILAAVVRLLEMTLIRVGNEEYAKSNKSYGLTTLRRKHVEIAGEKIIFEFKGKSGKEHEIEIRDRRLAKIIRDCQELPGQELFHYIDEEGELQKIDSEDVNSYLEEISGKDFSAKDFRTWAGTVCALCAFRTIGPAGTAKEIRNNISAVVKEVSRQLRNTPAVCRKFYIHPAVIDSYSDSTLLSFVPDSSAPPEQAEGFMYESERAVLEFLRRCRENTSGEAACRDK